MFPGNDLSRLIKSFWPSSSRPPKTANRRRSPSGRHSYDQLQGRHLLATFVDVGGDIVVNFVDGRPATVEIDGQTFVNPDDTLRLERIDDSVFGGFDVLPASRTNLTLLGDDFDVEIDGRTVNANDGQVILIGHGPLTLTTGDGDDFIDAGTPEGFETDIYFTGAGDDTFILDGGNRIDVFLGHGNDRYVETSLKRFNTEIHGGAGNDIFESTHSRNLYSEADYFDFESVIAPEPSAEFFADDRNSAAIPANSHVTIDGQIATLFRDDGTRTRFENYNTFIGNGDTSSNFVVREATIPVAIAGANNVILGGGLLDGDTSGIQEQVYVGFANLLLVSQSGSDQSQDVLVSEAVGDNFPRDPDVPTSQIFGLTEETILVHEVNNTVLAGGSANDRFFVSQFESHLILHGNEGDDEFHLGTNLGGGQRNLGLIGTVAIVAGSGSDFLSVDDTDSDANRRLRVRNNWIHSTGSSPNTEFQGVNFLGIENVDLKANQFTDRFLLSPSQETRIVIYGGRTDLEFNSLFQLQPEFEPISILVGPFSGFNTYLFENGFQNIFVSV